ncbi:MAG: ABC transporter ATP-binding protein [Actinomycetia bacterium]|nr:ABC transporter ATP-binding protein [Actinomycetes bacterium]
MSAQHAYEARGPARPPAVRTQELTKVYGRGETLVRALDRVSVDLYSGEFTAIMGQSGSGKSTLMHCAAGLDAPTSGRVWIGTTDITGLPDKALTLLRRDSVGFVFQAFNLLPTLTAKENILLPLKLAGKKPDPAWFDQVIDVLGMRERLGHRPSELSGGQQQRAAVARAMVTRPMVIFADEPTGALDSASGTDLLRFLRHSVVQLGQTVVMVTHDANAASYADRVIRLADGRIVSDERN